METRTVWAATRLLLLTLAVVACTETEVILPSEETAAPPPPPPAATNDTDGDGLTDEQEMAIGTSPIMADTDGDGFSDNEEITNGGTHPLIADVPSFSVDVTGSPTIDIQSTYKTNVETSKSYSASLAQGRESSYSRSDSTSTTNTTEQSDRTYDEISGGCDFTGCGGAAKAGSESTSTATNTRERSTNVTSASAQSSREEYSAYAGDTSGAEILEESGSLNVTLKITNTSARSFRIRSIDVIAKNHSADGRRLETIDELPLAPDGGRDLVPGAAIEQFVTGKGTSITKLKELMRNPSGLLFTVGSVSIDNVSGGDPDRDFAEISQSVFNQTARVVIDFGNRNGGRSGSVETYLVATNIARDPVTQEPLGVTMQEVMENILEIPYETAMKDVLDDSGNPTGEQQEVLSAVRNVRSASVTEGVWYVYSDSETLDADFANFNDIVLTDDNYINLVFLADADGDFLFNREEQLHGTDMNSVDTDGDGLNDDAEVKVGWTAISGFNSYAVYSDPLTPDADGDGLSDPEERAAMTDPNLADTDGDGEDDLVDTDPTGGDTGVHFNLRLTGPGNRIKLAGSIVSNDDIDAVRIDWGDGTPEQTLAGFSSIDARHVYADKGQYTVTVTADRPFGNDPARRYSVTLAPSSTDDIGAMTFNAVPSWNEAIDKRLVADVNHDGRVDLVGFGPDGVWVSMAKPGRDPGFEPAVNVLSEFASSEPGFGQHIHYLANVGGGPEPEIVVFHDDGVRVALNSGGQFSTPELWTDDFGAKAVSDPDAHQHPAYDPEQHPRLLADINQDGFDDIVGFLEDGVRVALSYGVGFDPASEETNYYSPVHSWTRQNPRLLADANGDGYPDIIGFSNSDTSVTLNALSPEVGADGNHAIFGSIAFRINRWSGANSYNVDSHIRLAVNITGDDGTADIVAFANGSTAANRIHADTGFESTAYTVSTDYGLNDGWDLVEHDRYVIDVTGDGNPDVVGFKDDIVLYSTNLADNGRFDREAEWPGADILFGNDWDGLTNPRFVGDVNGDGVNDLIGVADDGVVVEYSALIESL